MGSFVNPTNTAFSKCFNSEIYVDKSELIAFTNKKINSLQQYICSTRPRRFGKTMAVDMLAAYYSKGLSVHHIEPLDERFDLRLEDENLITCCPWHHKMAEDGDIPRDYLHELAQTSPRWDRSQNL